ncbi:CoA transferase [Nocardioides sp. LML1-1-1.1]
MAGLAPAPFGCMILADLGADVLRVERGGGNQFTLVPRSGMLDRGRRTLALNLMEPAVLATLLVLVDSADALVEGFGRASLSGSASGRTCFGPATRAWSMPG